MEDADKSVVTNAKVSKKRKDVEIATGESSCYDSDNSYRFEVKGEGVKAQVKNPAVKVHDHELFFIDVKRNGVDYRIKVNTRENDEHHPY